MGRFEKGPIFEDDEENDSDVQEESPEVEPDVPMRPSQARGNTMGKRECVPFPCLCGATFSPSGTLNCHLFPRSSDLLLFYSSTSF